jgi:hypothetical protein
LVTVTAKVPAMARSEALTVMVGWLLLTNLGACRIPWNATGDEVMNPLPWMTSLSALVPAGAKDGDRPVIAG